MKLESLKFDNTEDGLNVKNIAYEVAEYVLESNARKRSRSTSKKLYTGSI